MNQTNLKRGRVLSIKGFTLMEVIVIVAIIGIMSSIAVPAIRTWAPNYRLKSAAREVFSNLQKARSMAVKFNRNTAVVFDTANSRVVLCDNWDTSVSPSICIGEQHTVDFVSAGYGIGYGHGNATQDVPGGAFPLGDVTFSANTAVFNSRGLLAGTSGYVYLDHQTNTATYAVGSLTSGVVRILKWQGGIWQ